MQALLALIARPRTLNAPAWWAVGLFAGVLVPLAFLPAIVSPVGGYTWSLLVFAVPSLVLARSLAAHGALALVQRPVLEAWSLLVPMGVLLNLCFADDFFTYPNATAVSGLSVPAFDLSGLDLEHPIPLEEFAFYGLGFLAMLLGYAWASTVLLPRPRSRQAGKVAWLDALVVPLALVGAGAAIADGALSYWAYLCLVPLPVTLALWPKVKGRLNVPALLVTMAVLVAVSIAWEAVLALPRGWWGYRADALMGRAFGGVPLEAVAVWVLAPVTTAVLFESLRLRRSPA